MGQPFLAMANPGAYAPFNFLYFLRPMTWAFTLDYLLHLSIAGLGTYIFLRGVGTGRLSALLGGVAFMGSGFFMGHLYAGHNAIVNAGCWLPMIFHFLRRFNGGGKWWPLVLASVFMGFCELEGMPQVNLYAVMFGLSLLAWGRWRGWIGWNKLFVGAGGFLFLSISLGLCQLAPTYQFAKLSDRWHWYWKDLMKEFFDPAYFRFLIDPFFMGKPGISYDGTWGYHEIILYVGLLPFFLAVAGIPALIRKRPVVSWLIFALLLSVGLAMADSTRLTHDLYMFFFLFLPGFGHNRSVSRITCVTSFALACLAGLALDAWVQYWKGKPERSSLRNFAAVAVPLIFLVGTILDLGRFDRVHVQPTDIREFFDPQAVFSSQRLADIQSDAGYPRFQSDRFSDPGVLFKVSKVMTRFPTRTRESAFYIDQQWAHPDTPLSDLIGLKYAARDATASPDGRWRQTGGVDGTVWENTKAFPRAFLVGGYTVEEDADQTIRRIRDGLVDPRQQVVLTAPPLGSSGGVPGWEGPATITNYGYNQLEIACENERPCFLFLSDSYFPGWKAWVDGEPRAINEADGAFRAVEIAKPGRHSVKMIYAPAIITWTFFYSALAWAIFTAAGLHRYWTKRDEFL
ncbi:MAG TPA: hypothetical protein VMV05_05135 [bacterium]|nr:hypothetical protein [bacterium]